MNVYSVTIKVEIQKTYNVLAENEEIACEIANEGFSLDCDGPENYDQQVVSVLMGDESTPVDFEQ
jgi:hypothetical protein